jgi:hypothetical protein
MSHLPDETVTNARCSPSRGSLDPALLCGGTYLGLTRWYNSLGGPRSEDCVNGMSR